MTHERMKRDPGLFLACPFQGIQRIERSVSMLRNCPRCDSTLSLEMAHVMTMFPLVKHAVDEEVA
jgi:hypothetical protein